MSLLRTRTLFPYFHHGFPNILLNDSLIFMVQNVFGMFVAVCYFKKKKSHCDLVVVYETFICYSGAVEYRQTVSYGCGFDPLSKESIIFVFLS